MKTTLRRFTLSVPTGETQPQMLRTFVRSADGVEYPDDREVQVPVFKSATHEVTCVEGQAPALSEVTEQSVLALYPQGTRVLECRDIVTIEE